MRTADCGLRIDAMDHSLLALRFELEPSDCAAIDLRSIHPHLPMLDRVPVLQEVGVMRRERMPCLTEIVQEPAGGRHRKPRDAPVAGDRLLGGPMSYVGMAHVARPRVAAA